MLVRRISLWGVVLGWTATRCVIPAFAEDTPFALQPVAQVSATPAPAPPPSAGDTSSVPSASSTVPFGSPVPTPLPQPIAQPAPLPGVANPARASSSNAPQNLGKGESVTLEVVTERYPNKQIAIERNVARDQKNNYVNHGTWTMWDPEGREICKGDFYQGKATGKWTRVFHDNGEDAYTGVEYSEFSRPFRAEATYAEDKLVGTWTLADDEGRLIHSWEFNEDRLNGKSMTFYANGKTRRELSYKNSVLDGEAIEFDIEGNKIASTMWQAGRKLGPTTQRYPSGAKYSEGEYFYAREEKNTTYDFFKGTIAADKLAKKGSDTRHGHWVWWYEDGDKMCEGDFIDGKPVGHHVWYHPNGQRQMEGDFDAGKRTGVWITWHANGQKKSEGGYEQGKESGQWFEWNDDGKVARSVRHAGPRSLPFTTAPKGGQPQAPNQPEKAIAKQPTGVQTSGTQIPGLNLPAGQWAEQIGPNEYIIHSANEPATMKGQPQPQIHPSSQQYSEPGRQRVKPLVEYLPKSVRR